MPFADSVAVLLDQYGFTEPAAYVPEAVLWDCQQPGLHDGQWAVVSANFMVDSGNCIWLMQYPHRFQAMMEENRKKK